MADKKADNTDPQPAEQEANWQFSASEQTATQAAQTSETLKPSSITPVSWTASEFIAHSKNASWYIMLAIATLLIAFVVFLLTHHDVVTTVFIFIVGGIFGFMGSRQPRELPYTVSDQGIQIGPKQFKYSQFRSFSVVQEVGIESIWLMPMKRLMPAIFIYFEPKDQSKIVDIIAQYLPMENRELDAFDKLMHQLRF